MITETSTIPPDDLQRNLALARPNEDQKLPHIGLAGDTYTILLTGKDTAGRYCLIDMLVPPGGGPPPHRHDFEEMFTILDGEIEVTSATTSRRCLPFSTARSRSLAVARNPLCGPARQPTFRPTHRTIFATPRGDRRGYCAFVHQPGRKSILWPLAFPSQVALLRPQNSTRPAKRCSKRKLKRSLHNTERNFYTLHSGNPTPNPVAGANRRWRCQFRYRGSRH